jgi:hypothetical protein
MPILTPLISRWTVPFKGVRSSYTQQCVEGIDLFKLYYVRDGIALKLSVDTKDNVI